MTNVRIVLHRAMVLACKCTMKHVSERHLPFKMVFRGIARLIWLARDGQNGRLVVVSEKVVNRVRDLAGE
jgi:hypothetical protein